MPMSDSIDPAAYLPKAVETAAQAHWRATRAFEDHGLKLPGRISEVTGNASENNQRGFYTRWRQFMEAGSWKDLGPR